MHLPLILSLLVLALAAVGIGIWRWQAAPTVGGGWITDPVSRGDVASAVTAGGTLSALVTVQVGSQMSGRLLTLTADFNSQVRKGQVLATMDPLLVEAAVTQATANLAAATANLAKARATEADAKRQTLRQEDLFAHAVVTQADLDTMATTQAVATAGVQVAEAGVHQAEAALAQTRTNLTYATILSPIDGVVISRHVDVGQTVAASFTAPVLFTIAEDLRRMQVDTSVAEADVGRIRDGMAATFRVDAWPEQIFVGTVRQVRNAATVLQNVVTYDAVIDVSNPDLRLKPGMTANVTFTTASATAALRVANGALRFHHPGTEAPDHSSPTVEGPATGRRRTVWVLHGDLPVAVPVVIGITDGIRSEVLSGDLRVGDLVCTGTTAADRPATGGMLGMPSGNRRSP
jgi:HlyD family secretion protein